MKIARLQLESELFEAVHRVFLLTLIDSEMDGRDDLLAELVSLSHSRSTQLYVLMQLNRCLREIIFKFADSETKVPVPPAYTYRHTQTNTLGTYTAEHMEYTLPMKLIEYSIF